MMFGHIVPDGSCPMRVVNATQDEVFKMFLDWGFVRDIDNTFDSHNFSLGNNKTITISEVWFPSSIGEPEGIIKYDDPLDWFIDVIDDWENPKPVEPPENGYDEFDWNASSIDIHGGIFFGFGE